MRCGAPRRFGRSRGVPACARISARSQALLQGSAIAWGAQDCSAHDAGAFTGEVSAAMLAEFGCRYVIVGHSERRAMHGETDRLVADKAQRALAAGLTPIVCVGETLAEREAGADQAVVARQLGAVTDTLGAAVGRDRRRLRAGLGDRHRQTATPAQAQDVHAYLRAALARAERAARDVAILYGGSVKPDNAAALFGEADIDGGLIGGASLKAQAFVAICRAAA